ncbi:hypothetical protein K443DRAFT_498624 [Laccaria amethystina LaAM-08-1]|uniref:Zn(2)-C6 fungal-type domain-containing protein n=1 Tax=Laccaria amethystina LaAM-08-1 TaxID=1095629 RepID=A0A0C9YLV3_9AGAR|nr:hypothetical protein K443DRAFT_498624 [Laccaria amethystina LaAM-08-1]
MRLVPIHGNRMSGQSVSYNVTPSAANLVLIFTAFTVRPQIQARIWSRIRIVTVSPSTFNLPLWRPSSSNSSHQSPYYTSQSNMEIGTAHQAKHPRKNPSAKDGNPEDHDGDAGAPEVKDNGKAKPARACARCKILMVKCEAKTESDPCKRCLNGGHDCVTPGRGIRRTHPLVVLSKMLAFLAIAGEASGGVMAEVVSVSLEPLATVGGEWCGIETDGIGVDKELKCSC